MTTAAATKTIRVHFNDDSEETFDGVTRTEVADGVLRLWFRGPHRVIFLPLIGIRMWTRELT